MRVFNYFCLYQNIASIIKYSKGNLRLGKVIYFAFPFLYKRKCLELNNWIPLLFRIGRRQNILNLFGRRRNNRGMMWTSLLGLVVSAAAFGIGRNRNRNLLSPVQNFMNNIRMRNASQMRNMSTLMEFSKELEPNKSQLKNK